MRNKRGIVFGLFGLFYLLFVIVILVLLIWFGFRISEGISAFFGFLKEWWWAIALSISTYLFRNEIRAIIRKVLKI